MESNRIEYKRELTDNLEKEVVAFLNYHDGGVIYIGIDDSGKTYGVLRADAVQLAVKDRLKNNIQPSALGLFDVIPEKKDGRDIIKIIVASGSEKPYYLRRYGMSEKGCFMRLGSASEPMPVRIIEDLFSRRTRNSLTRIRSPRQDLHFEQLKIYYQERGLALNDKFAATLELLTEEGEYNYAAYLLADENGNSVQVARYAGTGRVELQDSRDYGFCCLVKTCKLVLDRLESVENRVVNRITPKERIDRPYWNSVALREAVINAVIHNDYSTELVPKFELFTDRLEITSAGTVHGAQEQNEFFAGYSMPRNKGLMRVFKDLEMVEYLGSGMPRILKAYSREAFTFAAHFIRVTFPVSQAALDLEKELEKGPAASSGGVGESVVKSAVKVIRIMRENPSVTRLELSGLTGLSVRGIDRIIANLKQDNKIKRSGSDKKGQWEVFEDGKKQKQGKATDTLKTVVESAVKSAGKSAVEIISIMQKNPSVTRQELSGLTGLSVRGVDRIIANLKRDGIIARSGSDKKGHWEVVEDIDDKG